MAFPQVGSMIGGKKSAATTSIDLLKDEAQTTTLSGITEGDLLLTIWVADDSVTWPDPSGWEVLFDISIASSYRTKMLAKVATGSDTCIIDRSASSRTLAWATYRITDWGGTLSSITTLTNTGTVDGTDLYAAVSKMNSGSSNHAGVTAPWGSDDNLFIAFAGRAYADITGWPWSGNNIAYGSTATGTQRVGMCTLDSASASADPPAWPTFSTLSGALGTLVIKPASAAPAVDLEGAAIVGATASGELGVKMLKLLTNSAAVGATVDGVVFAAQGGAIVGAEIGEFTGKTIAAGSGADAGKGVLLIPVTDFGGTALNEGDEPLVYLRSSTHFTPIWPGLIVPG